MVQNKMPFFIRRCAAVFPATPFKRRLASNDHKDLSTTTAKMAGARDQTFTFLPMKVSFSSHPNSNRGGTRTRNSGAEAAVPAVVRISVKGHQGLPGELLAFGKRKTERIKRDHPRTGASAGSINSTSRNTSG